MQLRICVLAVTIIACGQLGFAAQAPQPKGGAGVAVTGVVTDPQGGVIPGAQVELTISNAAASATAGATLVTEAAGAFRFDRVAPGSYDLRVSFEGFEPKTVHVTVGSRAPGLLRVTLAVAGLAQEVTVSNGGLQADTTAGNNLNAIVVDQNALNDLPVFDQDYVGTLSRFLDAGSIGTNGVTLIVNGMEANSVGVSPSAIQQIKINQDPYSAEYSRPGRGRIEVITKAGAEAFHGTANLMFRDSTFNARDPFAASKPSEQRRIFEGFFGGPIGDGKRSSFVISANHDEEDQQAIVFAAGPNGTIQDNVPSPSRNTLISGSISHQRDEKTTITFRGSRQQRSQTNGRVGGLTLRESSTNYDSSETEGVYTQSTVLTPKLLHQTRVMYGQEYEDTVSTSKAPRIVVLDAFIGGGAQADLLRTEHHATLTDTLTWTISHHTVKGGINVPDWSRRRFDDGSNAGGTFYFASLSTYALGQPYAFVQQQGNGHVAFLEKLIGVFVQDEIQFNRNLTIALGLRYDWQNYFGDTNNVSPRGSIAWAPRALGRSIIRGGAGLFYDRSGPVVISDLLHSRDGRLNRYVLSDPGYPDPLTPGQSLAAQPRSLVQLAPDVGLPATLQYSLGVERQLGKATLSVTYIGMHGYGLFLSRDVNAPLPPLYDARPDPSLGVVRQIESNGRLQADSIQVTMRGGVTKFFNGQLQYTLGRTRNDTNGVTWFPANDYNQQGEWARADFDQRHRFDALGTFKVGDLMRLGVAVSLYSGKPYTLLAGQDLFNNGRSNARPAGVPRNSLDGPGYADVDVRWSRDLLVRPGKKLGKKPDDSTSLTVGLDAFNVLNRTNYSGYIGTIDSPLFGRAIAAQPPRRVQVSLRAKF
jgi:outer membrane receptor protein involved in Fe transport